MSCINIIFGHKYPISGKILPFSCKFSIKHSMRDKSLYSITHCFQNEHC